MKTTSKSNIFQKKKETAWENAGPGIKRKVYGYDENIMLVKVRFRKHAVGALHEHLHSQVTYVESGVFDVTIGNEKKAVKSGDGFYVPPGVLHGCICREPGILIDVFSPFREDFL